MILKVFTVRDDKAGAFMQPFFSPTMGTAERSFMDACKGEGPFAKYPHDYNLYYLCDYDDQTGKFGYVVERRTDHEGHPVVSQEFVPLEGVKPPQHMSSAVQFREVANG